MNSTSIRSKLFHLNLNACAHYLALKRTKPRWKHSQLRYAAFRCNQEAIIAMCGTTVTKKFCLHIDTICVEAFTEAFPTLQKIALNYAPFKQKFDIITFIMLHCIAFLKIELT